MPKQKTKKEKRFKIDDPDEGEILVTLEYAESKLRELYGDIFILEAHALEIKTSIHKFKRKNKL